MTELIVQKEGTNWALGIVGNKKIDVIQRFDYFYSVQWLQHHFLMVISYHSFK